MIESGSNYRILFEDLQLPRSRIEFGVTSRAVNCNRLMREKGLPYLSANELAALIACSKILRRSGRPGLRVSGMERLLRLRYAGRTLDLSPVSIRIDLEALKCISPSTSSGDANQPEPDASTSTETT